MYDTSIIFSDEDAFALPDDFELLKRELSPLALDMINEVIVNQMCMAEYMELRGFTVQHVKGIMNGITRCVKRYNIVNKINTYVYGKDS